MIGPHEFNICPSKVLQGFTKCEMHAEIYRDRYSKLLSPLRGPWITVQGTPCVFYGGRVRCPPTIHPLPRVISLDHAAPRLSTLPISPHRPKATIPWPGSKCQQQRTHHVRPLAPRTPPRESNASDGHKTDTPASSSSAVVRPPCAIFTDTLERSTHLLLFPTSSSSFLD